MTQSSRHAKKVWLGIFLIALLCCLTYTVASKMNHWWPFLPTPTNPTQSTQTGTNNAAPGQDQVNAGMDARKDFDNTQTEASQQQAAAQGSTTTKAHTVYVQLTNVSVENNILRVRSTIQTIDADGTCKLTLAHAGSTSITQTAKTQTMASYTSCQGFDIDKTKLTSGKWTVTLEYAGSNNRSGTASKEVSL